MRAKLYTLFTIIIATNTNAQWVSTNGPNNISGGSAVVMSMAKQGSKLFAGTWSGVFSTNNGGTTWNNSSTGIFNTVIQSMAVLGNRLFAGTQGGVYTSVDTGLTWTSVNGGLSSVDVLALTVDDTNVFVGTYGGTGVSRFNNYTHVWMPANGGLTNHYIAAMTSGNGNIYAGTTAGIFLSTNNGNNWTLINNGLAATTSYPLLAFGNEVFVQQGGVYYSANNGASWTPVNMVAPGSMIKDGNNMFASGSYGVNLSNYSGNNGWYNINSGMDVYQHSVMSLLVDGTTIYAGLTNGLVYKTTISDFGLSTPVWPGDTNHDSIVNNYDLLPIGIYFQTSGLVRNVTGNLWQADTSANWYVQQFNGADVKNVDCDGSWFIDSDDTLAINLNFNSTHAIAPPQNNDQRLIAPELTFITNSNTYNAGDIVDVEIWPGYFFTPPVSNLYGIAFNINYDPSVVQPGSESLTYPSSWLGTPSVDAITIAKIDPLATTAFGAETRINQTNASGNFGKIADFKFQVKNSITSTSILHLSFSGYAANDATGAPVLFNTSTLDLTINAGTVGVSKYFSDADISVSPNPVSDQLLIVSHQLLVKELKIFNLLGECVMNTTIESQKSNKTIIDVSSLHQGLYIVQLITTDKQLFNKKIEKK